MMIFSWILVFILALACIIEYIVLRLLNWSLNMMSGFVKQQDESKECDAFISESIDAALKRHGFHHKHKH